MLVIAAYLFFLAQIVSPQQPNSIHLPVLQEFSPAEEVNAQLQGTPKVQRSISDHAGNDNTENTIKEVERLIQSNPELPRLTRGEILDILDNITKQDHQTLLKKIGKDSNRDPKAFMVVKAYTPLGSGEVNVEEFYTKPPITSIVDDDDEASIEERPKPQAVVVTTTSAPYFIRRKPTKSSEDKTLTDRPKKKPSNRGSTQIRLSSVGTTTRTTTTTSAATTTPVSSTTRRDIKRRRRPIAGTTSTTTTAMPATTYRPRRRPPPRKEIKYTNHKYSEEELSSVRPSYPGIRVVRPPVISQAPSVINSELEDLLPQEMENEETFMPLLRYKPEEVKDEVAVSDNNKYTSISEPSIELEIPEHLKKVVADLNLAAIQNPESVSVTSIVPQKDKKETNQIKDILASIGVLPPPTASTSSTTETPNANMVADNLSPDMQELLKSFGLLPNPDDQHHQQQKKNEIVEFNPEKAEIDPNSYVGFKPLPENTDSRQEMEDLLTQFGLLDKTNRNKKNLRKGKQMFNAEKDIKVEKISLDAIPEEYKPLLEEMGFDGGRVGRKIREQPLLKDSDKTSNSTNQKQHVFNPADPNKYVSEEEIQKLGRLLEIMKKIENLNGTITEETINQIDKEELKELLTSINTAQEDNLTLLDEQNAPNPIEYDAGLDKNEVKRQEATTTEKIDSTSTTESLTEETKTPSIKDLEDSFGGSSATVTEALPESTTARRSGFYYLLDWNTFFEIDDQKGKRVNLRFQPKVGDPKQFFSVNVP